LNEDTGTVFADPTKIHQIVLNLCNNALQALKTSGGTLSIYLDSVVIDGKFSTAGDGLRTGRYALLVVKDTGLGIDPSVLTRIFEPFFTTKGRGEGTGLGLAVVYGIVQSLDGAIFAESKLGKGTTFRVYIPLSHGEKEVVQEKRYQGGSYRQRILFVDDDVTLVSVGEKTLQHLGHSVTAVSSGKRALDMFREDPAAFDMLITDQVMPEMTGLELIAGVRDVRPDMPVIICTGLSDFCDDEKMTELGANAIVMKPMKQVNISEAIDAVMRVGE
jgi:CheY-like chemotaxis protein